MHLYKIDDADSALDSFLGAGTEIKPLGASLCVGIILHVELVGGNRFFRTMESTEQVARLKATVKCDGVRVKLLGRNGIFAYLL